MKKIILIVAFILFTGLNGLLAQRLYFNPIPSFNCPVTAESTAAFKELKTHPQGTNREKRDMDVIISSSSTSIFSIFANVWIVKENENIVLGPYQIFENETLTVPIDNGRWGVVIRSDWNVTASVWTD